VIRVKTNEKIVAEITAIIENIRTQLEIISRLLKLIEEKRTK